MASHECPWESSNHDLCRISLAEINQQAGKHHSGVRESSALAKKLGTSKTEIVLALLNAGLERAGKLRGKDGRRGK